MTELHRVVQCQVSDRHAARATSSKANADALESLIEETKPPNHNTKWEALVATPFRYPLPTLPKYSARFKPPHFKRNVWYGAIHSDTAFYETSYHLMKQRIHIKDFEDEGFRTLFVTDCDLSGTMDISKDPNVAKIMDRHAYQESYSVALAANDYTGILYPSCRDPKQQLCAAMFEVTAFATLVKTERTIKFHYKPDKSVDWYRHHVVNLHIPWRLIS